MLPEMCSRVTLSHIYYIKSEFMTIRYHRNLIYIMFVT